MNAIIIAAGSGKRISNDVKETPKSLILVNEKPIIEYQIELLKQKKIENIIVITGKYSEKFHLKDVHYVNDPNFEKHDILGSLMVAKQFLNGNVIVLYSDIIFEEKILQQMLDSKGNISIGVDMNWEKNYDGRTEHPKSEAENVLIENEVKVVQIKKSISSSNKNIGEFLGIIKFSKYGSELFVKKYDEIFKKHTGKFHESSSISKAYLTDMIQEIIDNEIEVEPVFISGKWSEIDTMQDLKNAEEKF